MGFLISIVVAFSYFLFIIMAHAVRENPAMHPELLVWLPNVIFIGLGVVDVPPRRAAVIRARKLVGSESGTTKSRRWDTATQKAAVVVGA